MSGICRIANLSTLKCLVYLSIYVEVFVYFVYLKFQELLRVVYSFKGVLSR